MRRPPFAGILLTLIVVGFSNAAFAQRGGGGGRGGGATLGPVTRSRLDTLDVGFNLTKDQKKTIKGLLDDAQKNAAPAREGLLRTRAAVAAAIQGSKSPAEIDAAVADYAEQAAVMMAIEMKALAEVMKALTPAQRANNAAISTAFFLMRGAFLDSKKWDDAPDGRAY
jgi:Spy/CpxP family protein refolding chaperone